MKAKNTAPPEREPYIENSPLFQLFFLIIIIIYNHTEEHYIQFYTYINYIKDPSYVNCFTILVININIPLTLFCLHCL